MWHDGQGNRYATKGKMTRATRALRKAKLYARLLSEMGALMASDAGRNRAEKRLFREGRKAGTIARTERAV